MNDVAGNRITEPSRLFWMAAILLFLVPFSTSIEESGVSANYSFLILLAYIRPVSTWPNILTLFVGYSLFCYAWSLWIISPFPEDIFYWRQFVSVILFILPLLLMAIDMPFNTNLLIRVTVVCATIYAISVLFVVYFLLPSDTFFIDLKHLLIPYIPDWPQRYILILILGLFFSLGLAQRHLAWVITATLCGAVLFITSIRAGYGTAIISLSLLTVWYLWTRNWRGLKAIGITLLLLPIVLLAISHNPFASIEATTERMVRAPIACITQSYPINKQHPNMSIDGISAITKRQVTAPIEIDTCVKGNTSESLRVNIWKTLWNLMCDKKLWFGSGFAGPYIFFPEIGSAHSQYFDVLLRTGPIGLIFYLSLWYILLRRSFRYKPEIGLSLFAWFLFGLMHETTKYSYGAFIFFCLLNLSQYEWKRNTSITRESD